MTWIPTASGGEFWPLAPRAQDVDVCDIAFALSQTVRFTRHCRDGYSVAQHACLVSDLAGARVVPHLGHQAALWGLHHDDAEAYLCDVSSQIKDHVTVDGVPFREVEDRVLAAIAEALGLPWPMPEAVAGVVKAADLVLCATEKRDVMPPERRAWQVLPGPLPDRIQVWSPQRSITEFLLRHFRLVRQLGHAT